MVNIYKVGGAVRDQLLGLTPTDNDYVVVGADKDYMLSHGFIEVGRDFPVYLHPKTREEYALARLERKIGTGHKEFVFETQKTVTLINDLKRRDITINAMALDSNNKLIDPFNGYHDLQNKIIRHVSNSFSEDPLRVLRVARFAAKLNFTVAPETITLMKEVVKRQEILHLSRERIIEEIGKALLTEHANIFFQVLFEVGALEQVLPQLSLRIKESRSDFFQALISFDVNHCNLEERFAVIGYYMQDSKIFNKKSNRISYLLIKTYPLIKNFADLAADDILTIVTQFDPFRRHGTYVSIKKLFLLLAKVNLDQRVQENFKLLDQIIDNFTSLDYAKLPRDNNFVTKLRMLKLSIINNIIKGPINELK